MKKLAFHVIILGVALFFSCHKKSPTETPPNNTIHPQVNIPWTSLADSPWPMFHHDPQSTGRSQYIGPRKGKIKWTFKPGGTIASAIIIGSDSTIYFESCYEGEWQTSSLYAVRPDGALRWKLPLSIGPESQPIIVSDGTIFIAGRELYAVNPDGILKQSISIGEALPPFLNIGLDGTLYLVVDGYLYAINQQLEIIWKSYLDNGFLDLNLTISPDGKILYLYNYLDSEYHSALCAIEAETGNLLWKYPTGELITRLKIHPSMVDSDGNIYFGAYGGLSEKAGFYAINSEGKQRWFYSCDPLSEPTIDLLGRFYFQDIFTSHSLISLDYLGNLWWREEIEFYTTTTTICDRENVVYIYSTPHVTAYSSDGKQLWQVPLEGKISRISPPAIGWDGTLYIGTFTSPLSEGTLYAIH